MADQNDQHGSELMELSGEELIHVDGGDIVPTDRFSVNYANIEFEYKPQKPD